MQRKGKIVVKAVLFDVDANKLLPPKNEFLLTTECPARKLTAGKAKEPSQLSQVDREHIFRHLEASERAVHTQLEDRCLDPVPGSLTGATIDAHVITPRNATLNRVGRPVNAVAYSGCPLWCSRCVDSLNCCKSARSADQVDHAATARWQERVPLSRAVARNVKLEWIGQLGAGAFGKVYLAIDHSIKRYCALKLLPKSLFQERRLDDLEIERVLLGMFDSPFIVLGLSAFQTAKFAVLGMEYVDGLTLEELDRQPEPILAFLMGQVMAGVTALHEKLVIHRDLKAENVLVSRAGRCKITDLGLAKILPDRTAVAKTFVGTPGVMAREQARCCFHGAAGYSFAADWFGVGAMLYECLVGRRPFTFTCQDDCKAMATKMITEPIAIPIGDFSEEVVDLLQQLLRAEVAERLSSFEAAIHHDWFVKNKINAEHLEELIYGFEIKKKKIDIGEPEDLFDQCAAIDDERWDDFPNLPIVCENDLVLVEL